MDFSSLNNNEDDKKLAVELLNKKDITLKTEFSNQEICKLLQVSFIGEYVKLKGLTKTSKSIEMIIKKFAELRVSNKRQGRKEFADLLKNEIKFQKENTELDKLMR